MWVRFRPPFRIGLRTQLTVLVCFIALVSLIIIAVITGIYFTSTYRALRADRLRVAAQLKSSQVDQDLNYLYYEIYWLSTRDTIEDALIRYLTGNSSEENWVTAQYNLESFLDSSDLFSVARLYDSNLSPVISVTNNGSGDYISNSTLSKLMPLSTNATLSSSLLTTGILTDPVRNSSNYLLSMSLPVLTSTSILLGSSDVVGFLTVVASSESLKSVVNDTTALENSEVLLLSALYDTDSTVEGYHYVFPPTGTGASIIDVEYTISNGSFAQKLLVYGKSGSVIKTSLPYKTDVAVGYSPCSFQLSTWGAVIIQPESVFLSPITKLTKIIVGTVCGIAAFTCILTFPIAHWAVKPIVRLQKATELIAAGRGLRSYGNGTFSDSNTKISHSRSQSLSSRASKLFSRTGGFFSPPPELETTLSQNYPEITERVSESSARNSQSSSRKYFFFSRTPTQNSSPQSNDSNSLASEKCNNSTGLISASVPVYRRFFEDELSELTDTFNTMTDELDRHYALLEDRVRARTRQLEAAKIEAESANEAKTVFIANISHELRTPLNGILGMTAIAMAENDTQKIQESLRLIFRSGELLLHILTELLTFSKNVLKRTKLEERDFSVMDIALQIKSIFGKLAKDQHVKLSILLYPNSIRSLVLWGDSNRIIQIVMNLVSNALKFTPVDGKVDVRMKVLGEYDEERSMKSDYREVFVLPDTTSAEYDIVSSRTRSKNQPYTCNSRSEAFETSSEDESQKEHSLTEDEKLKDSQEGDQVSIISTSTSSTYDDAIFLSQFKKVLSTSDSEKTEELGIKIAEPKTWVISIEVEDTGPGIEPALHDSVFEPFVQGDQTLSRQYGGTGLGLSICRQLARMMRGTMQLYSEVGVGSKFVFTVPLKQTRELQLDNHASAFEDEFNENSKKNRRVKFKINSSKRSIATKKSRTSLEACSQPSSSDQNAFSSNDASVGRVRVDRPFLQSTGTATSTRTASSATGVEPKFKVLVAEDNSVNQEVIKRMLQLEGIHDFDLACDGQEACDKVREMMEKGEDYSIIFMDVQMPRVDGLLATKMIREDLAYHKPIVALTAFADDSNIKVCLESGMDGFLPKPIKRPMLKKILEQYCSAKNE